MARKQAIDTILPAESNPKVVEEREVTLSGAVVAHYGLESDRATLVEQGEVESVVRVGEEIYVVGNGEVK